MTQFISRRELLKRAGMVGATAVVPSLPIAAVSEAAAAAEAAQTPAAPAREPLETLTSAEAIVLEAAVARIIPTDANGPGAKEARAARYIDRALGGYLSSSRDAYSNGLAALDAYARQSKGQSFAGLAVADQDTVLKVVEKGDAPGFRGSSSQFFAMLRQHTIEGTFCDPYYGGNANFVGWDLIGYPGPRTMVTAAEQRMSQPATKVRKSAYDYPGVNKDVVDNHEHGDDHGD
jgi:gluconate 2-dehydrogenase gamma chain